MLSGAERQWEWAGPAMGVLMSPTGFGDLDDMAFLWDSMAREGGKVRHQPRYWREQTAQLMAGGQHVGVIAREAGVPIGFADVLIEFDAADAEYLALGRTLFVAPQERGRRLARALMTGVLALARQRGCAAILTHGEPSKREMAKMGLAYEPAAVYVRARL